MHVNISATTFQPVMKAEENVGEDLYTQVARYCHEQIIRDTGMKDLGLCPDLVERNSKIAAKISFDFADAFMRERYERECIARSGMKANIPDHLGQLNQVLLRHCCEDV